MLSTSCLPPLDHHHENRQPDKKEEDPQRGELECERTIKDQLGDHLVPTISRDKDKERLEEIMGSPLPMREIRSEAFWHEQNTCIDCI